MGGGGLGGGGEWLLIPILLSTIDMHLENLTQITLSTNKRKEKKKEKKKYRRKKGKNRINIDMFLDPSGPISFKPHQLFDKL